MQTPQLITVAVAAAFVLAACNKDDVIEDPSTGKSTFRPATAGSSALCDKVYEWTPAPGQFINDNASGGIPTSPSAAAAVAKERLDARLFVSLGAFGGYIVVGFDHSIRSSEGDYDFAVAGNAFYNAASGKGGSSEPGIVYVMQDTNGNGLPDDTWFELKGSDHGKAGTIRDYAVTYRRPAAPASDVEWTDNQGGSGCIDYLATFHKQDYYYPEWIADDTYTLTGTCLTARNTLDPETGFWNNNPLEWGYADNMGSDCCEIGNYKQCNRFRISDAIDADGGKADIDYIDFVKISTGVNAKSGWLGEVSTEVCGVIDLSLLSD